MSPRRRDEWTARAKRFNVKLGTFLRGKVREHIYRRNTIGETDDDRLSRVVTADPGEHLGVGVQVTLSREERALIKQWAAEEGITQGAYVASIMYPTGRDIQAKRFFPIRARPPLAPKILVTGPSGEPIKLDEIVGVIIRSKHQVTIGRLAQKGGVSAFDALDSILEAAGGLVSLRGVASGEPPR
jgi:hypothetical protein